MLDLEEGLAARGVSGNGGPQLTVSMPEPKVPLGDFLCMEMAEKGAKTKDQLRALAQAAHYFTKGESGGRAIHATLVNLMKKGRVGEISEGLYGVPVPEKESFLK